MVLAFEFDAAAHRRVTAALCCSIVLFWIARLPLFTSPTAGPIPQCQQRKAFSWGMLNMASIMTAGRPWQTPALFQVIPGVRTYRRSIHRTVTLMLGTQRVPLRMKSVTTSILKLPSVVEHVVPTHTVVATQRIYVRALLPAIPPLRSYTGTLPATNRCL